MKTTGRKTYLKTPAFDPVAGRTGVRPEPPAYLTDDEAAMWRDIVAERVPNFFDAASCPLLADYCQLETTIRRFDDALAGLDLTTDEGLDRYKSLVAERDRVHGRRLGLAKAMRLNQQARYVPDARSARPGAAAEPPPWDTIR